MGPSQLQSLWVPLSPRQQLAKSLMASALVPAGSSGRQWLPSASSALVVRDRHVVTPCRSSRRTGGDTGQHRLAGGLSPLHCGTSVKVPGEEPHSSPDSSSSGSNSS